MINIYGQKTFVISGTGSFFTSTIIFDFGTAGLGGANVINGAVYLVGNLSYLDTAGQAGGSSIEQGFRCTSGTVFPSTTQFKIVPHHGNANFQANSLVNFSNTTNKITLEVGNSTGGITSNFILFLESHMIT